MAPPPTTANELRRSFTGFFAARDHTVVPSASLIPHDPTVLFTVAGMVPFKPYFTGDEVPPFRRATDVQKCARAGGKHNDLDDVGRTRRHLVFFEMMGNFSFGDYFKEQAIPWAWEYVTEDLGFDGDRIWITVHTSDDEAEQIWHDVVGVPMERIQRLGDKPTTSGRWATPARAARAPSCTSTGARPTDPTAVRWPTRPASASWSSGTWSSCSTTRRRTARGRRCPGPRSTPARAWSAS